MRNLLIFCILFVIAVKGQRVAPGVPPQQYHPPPHPNAQYQHPNVPNQQVHHQQPQHVPQQQPPQQHQQALPQQHPPQQQVPPQQQQHQQAPPQPQQHQQAPPQQQHHQQAPPQQQQHVPIQQQQQQGVPPTGHNHAHGGQQQILHTGNIQEERDHIAGHMEVPIDTAQMTDQELQFHYFKMHDSDNNNKLDGCELIKSLIHWHEQGSKEQTQPGAQKIEEKIFIDNELVALVDPILNMDDANKDGYIDYPEFVRAQQKQQEHQQEQQSQEQQHQQQHPPQNQQQAQQFTQH